MTDDFKLAFVGHHAGATTGITLPMEKVLPTLASISGAMPDFTFNATKVSSQ